MGNAVQAELDIFPSVTSCVLECALLEMAEAQQLKDGGQKLTADRSSISKTIAAYPLGATEQLLWKVTADVMKRHPGAKITRLYVFVNH